MRNPDGADISYFNPEAYESLPNPDREGYQRWRPRFIQAMDQRYYTPRYLDSMFHSPTTKFFENDRAAVLAMIRGFPAGAMDVHFLVGAGDLDALVELAPQVETWGREKGCIGSVIESRSGWAKVMKKHGYEPHQIAVRKDL